MRVFVLVEPKFFTPPEMFPHYLTDSPPGGTLTESTWIPSSSSPEAAGASVS